MYVRQLNLNNCYAITYIYYTLLLLYLYTALVKNIKIKASINILSNVRQRTTRTINNEIPILYVIL